ncbi:polysaccharide pyruvyl transferase family protein [Intestinicryptomonas porci]|uniref:Polysaccharide pyruvyl transferase family protein n=1 Tax=Intestinicryptomonas porci TaxID=2926320 RepID=A0ABU4WHX1_9BACT|nr:polysaccharide pyruvyl transferase family protein [Opitutales bacterium CLA-KB-P66]
MTKIEKNIKISFCDINNFGDALNNLIFRNIFNVNPICTSVKKSDFIGIGSVLDQLLYKKREFLFSIFPSLNDPLNILSSGFGFDLYTHFRKKKYLSPLKIRRRIHCVALRGEKTKFQLEKILGLKIENVVLGDGGLLSSEIDNFTKTKKFSLGIIPHYGDAKSPIFHKICECNKNSIILNTNEYPPLEFLRKISECETIISTAMHPLIAADSLNIPNLWARISEDTTSYYKFEDYYSAFGLKKEPFRFCCQYKNIDKMIQENYDMPFKKIENVKKLLYTSIKKSIDCHF